MGRRSLATEKEGAEELQLAPVVLHCLVTPPGRSVAGSDISVFFLGVRRCAVDELGERVLGGHRRCGHGRVEVEAGDRYAPQRRSVAGE